MKYKVIVNGTETLCDKVTIDGFDYYVSDEKPKLNDAVITAVGNIHYIKEDAKEFIEYVSKLGKKVIATNNPNIDIPKVVDEVEKYSPRNIKIDNKIDYRISFTAEAFFKEGYKKSQETHPFSEEDVRVIFRIAQTQKDYGDYKPYTFEEAIELWKSQRIITIHAV